MILLLAFKGTKSNPIVSLSGFTKLLVGGTVWFTIDNIENIASIAPAAPNKWPVADLVELILVFCIFCFKSLPIAFNSIKSPNQFKFYWGQLKKWSGVNKTFKSSRATFSTRAAENGWNHLDIASQTGHKDLNVLKKHYTYIDARYLAKKLGR